jgi:hypothetical protein
MIRAQTVKLVRVQSMRLAVHHPAPAEGKHDFAAPNPYGGTLVANGYVAHELARDYRLIGTRDIWLAPVVLAIRQTDLDLIEQPVRDELMVVRSERNGLWERMHAFRRLPWYVRAWRAAIGRME